MEENGLDILHFEIGEPDFDTPEMIVNGCQQGLKEGMTHYTHSLGEFNLRAALAKYKEDTRGTYFDPNTQFMVTGGTSPAFLNVMATLINPGDEVVITDPAYPCYENFIRFFGGVPVRLRIFEEDEFDIRTDALKTIIDDKTKMVIINSPSNPTGQIIPEHSLDELADIINENKIWTISDEIYSNLTYDLEIAPSLSDKSFERCHDRLIVLDGFSKFWAMTGWRLGYIIAPPALIKAMMPIQQNFMICAPSMSQAAALHALECKDATQNMLGKYLERRNLIVKRLNEIDGISCLSPKGAFYAFANIKEISNDSMKFCYKMLDEAHLAATPGISFGDNGEGFVRFSYPTDLSNIGEGMDRLTKFVTKML